MHYHVVVTDHLGQRHVDEIRQSLPMAVERFTLESRATRNFKAEVSLSKCTSDLHRICLNRTNARFMAFAEPAIRFTPLPLQQDEPY